MGYIATIYNITEAVCSESIQTRNELLSFALAMWEINPVAAACLFISLPVAIFGGSLFYYWSRRATDYHYALPLTQRRVMMRRRFPPTTGDVVLNMPPINEHRVRLADTGGGAPAFDNIINYRRPFSGYFFGASSLSRFVVGAEIVG
ncbi:hypothetical protein BJX65DRAFT_308717 [Aspergillus insuetus]